MSDLIRGGLLAVALLGAVPLAQAQPARAAPDPLDARAQVPPVMHASALANYRAAGELRVGSWKDANERVNRIGGWRAYAREAATPEPAASEPAVGPAVGPAGAHKH